MHSASQVEAILVRAIAALRAGEAVLLLDGDGRAPDRGVAIMAAERVDAASLLRFSRRALGQYLALTDERCQELGLELAAERDDALLRPPLTVAICAREGVTAGAGMVERAHTIRVASDPGRGRDDIRLGGQVLPLRSRPGGVLERAGFTEASIDLVRAAGLVPAAVHGEVLRPDGELARGEELVAFAAQEQLPTVSISDVIAHRRRTDRLVRWIVTTRLETPHGPYQAHGYLEERDQSEHIALVLGDVTGRADVPVYIHPACWEGDVFGSRACDCRARLDAAEAAIRAVGHGALIHLAHRGYHRHERRTPDDQIRDFGVGAQILADLGLTTIAVLTDHARPLPGLEGFGLTVTGHRPLLSAA